ncbi:hypothetical protein OROMI_026496 [Orobanche minor]
MGTLMHSSSIPCKHNPISPLITRLAPLDMHRKPAPLSMTSFPLLPRLILRRFNSSACGMNDFSLFSAEDCRPKKSSSLAVESGNESNPKPHFRNRVAHIFSQQQNYLHEMLKKAKMLDMFAFVDPYQIATQGCWDGETRARTLSSRFATAKKGQLFIMPYNTGRRKNLSISLIQLDVDYLRLEKNGPVLWIVLSRFTSLQDKTQRKTIS